MAALTEERNTREVYCGAMTITRVRTKQSNSTLYAGAMAASDANGKACPAADTANLTVLGRYEGESEGSAIIRSGVFVYDNGTGTEALAATDIGAICYALDDHTVGKVGGTNKIPAGVVREIVSGGVAVEIGNLTLGVPAHTHTVAQITDIASAYAAIDHTHESDTSEA